MLDPGIDRDLPPIPAKRYFTIGEVSELCGVKPHVLRYWEQEFEQLKPVKRRGNRRYYQRGDVMMIRQIRSLLYEQGYTIGGARQMLEGDEARDDVNRSALALEIVADLGDELEMFKPFLKKAEWKDGKFHYKCVGTVGRPSCTEDVEGRQARIAGA